MAQVREKIEKWYQDRGLPFCYVGYFDGMEEGVMRANVIEAKINDVSVKWVSSSAYACALFLAVETQPVRLTVCE